MNWYGIVIRCGEHELQTTRPHFLVKKLAQSCLLRFAESWHKAKQSKMLYHNACNIPAVVLPDKEACKVILANIMGKCAFQTY